MTIGPFLGSHFDIVPLLDQLVISFLHPACGLTQCVDTVNSESFQILSSLIRVLSFDLRFDRAGFLLGHALIGKL